MMPETTMGMTNIARSPILKRMREVSPRASPKAMTLTTMTVTKANPKVNRKLDRIAGSPNAAM